MNHSGQNFNKSNQTSLSPDHSLQTAARNIKKSKASTAALSDLEDCAILLFIPKDGFEIAL